MAYKKLSLVLFFTFIGISSGLSDNFGFLVNNSDISCWKNDTHFKKNGINVFEDYIRASTDVIAIADGDSSAPFSSYHLAQSLVLEMMSQFENQVIMEKDELKSVFLDRLIEIIKEYSQFMTDLKDDIINEIDAKTTKSFKYFHSKKYYSETKEDKDYYRMREKEYSTILDNIDQHKETVIKQLTTESTITSILVTDSLNSEKPMLNILQLGDSSVVHFKQVHKNGLMYYKPNFFTGDDKLFPTGAAKVSSDAESVVNDYLTQFCKSTSKKPEWDEVYKKLLEVQLQTYFIPADIGDLVLAATDGVYKHTPLPLLTVAINFVIHSMQKFKTKTINGEEYQMKKLLIKFVNEFKELVAKQEAQYKESLDNSLVNEKLKYISLHSEWEFKKQNILRDTCNNKENTNKQKSGKRPLRLPNLSSGKLVPVNYDDAFKDPHSGHSYFYNNYQDMEDIQEQREIAEKEWIFDENDKLVEDIAFKVLDESMEVTQMETETQKPAKSNIFEDCTLSDLIAPPSYKPDLKLDIVPISICVEKLLEKYSFEVNYFEKEGYKALSKFINVLANDFIHNNELTANPLHHNKRIIGENYKTKTSFDITTGITQIIRKTPKRYNTRSQQPLNDKSINEMLRNPSMRLYIDAKAVIENIISPGKENRNMII